MHSLFSMHHTSPLGSTATSGVWLGDRRRRPACRHLIANQLSRAPSHGWGEGASREGRERVPAVGGISPDAKLVYRTSLHCPGPGRPVRPRSSLVSLVLLGLWLCVLVGASLDSTAVDFVTHPPVWQPIGSQETGRTLVVQQKASLYDSYSKTSLRISVAQDTSDFV